MVLVEPLSSATSKFERPPEFSILLPATAMIFLQLEGIAAPYLVWHASVFLRLRGSQLPISDPMYGVSGSKPRTASNRSLVEGLIEALAIGLTTEIIRPLLSHSLEVDSPANQLQ